MRQRFLVLSASMGAGHDAVADELADRLRARGHSVRIKDVLALLPSGVGAALRAGYRGAVRHVPQVYGLVYDAFLAPGPQGAAGDAAVPRPGSAPLAALAERPLMRVVDNWQPDAVISTFHLSAQVTGRLRARGALRVPSVVAVIDFAVHRGWLH
uniref:MGDG synthase family glycosyltransferase n=1 Tax=Streptomyces albidus (ex Kaewkla and Franco 2022) TaxID=722709 RepID=UPI003AF327B3